jgi:nitrogen regulatory protein P-II 1
MIVAFVQPFMTEKVVQALHAVEGLSGASFTTIHGFGRGRGDERGAIRHQEILGAIKKVRFEVMVTDELLDTVVRTIRDAARTGRKGDGKILRRAGRAGCPHQDRRRGTKRSLTRPGGSRAGREPRGGEGRMLRKAKGGTAMRHVVMVVLAVALLVAAVDARADCDKRVDEAREAIKQAEAAVGKAKESGKNAARVPLAKAKKGLLHAEAECKTEKDVGKQAEAAREAREAQGWAEEALILAEGL